MKRAAARRIYPLSSHCSHSSHHLCATHPSSLTGRGNNSSKVLKGIIECVSYILLCNKSPPKPSDLNVNGHFLFLMVSVGWELGKGSAEQFPYGVSQVITIKSRRGWYPWDQLKDPFFIPMVAVCFIYLFLILAVSRSMQDLSSLTKDQTHALYRGNAVLTTGPPGSPRGSIFKVAHSPS